MSRSVSFSEPSKLLADEEDHKEEAETTDLLTAHEKEEFEVEFMPKENSSSSLIANITMFQKKLQNSFKNSLYALVAFIVCGLVILYFANEAFRDASADASMENAIGNVRVKILPADASDSVLNSLPKESFDYLAMIDAGSSGCRAHIYRYGRLGSDNGPIYILPEHKSLKVKPGLSTFVNNPADAGPNLKGLIDFMKEQVPPESWATTPIWLKATAGMRLVAKNDQDAILSSVRQFLSDPNVTPFYFRPSYAKIIPGKEEGAFGWTSVNYLKDIIGPRKKNNAIMEPFAVVEMGGASSQVTQLIPDKTIAQQVPSDYKIAIKLDNEVYSLYTYSYLGFGADQARDHLNEALVSRSRDVVKDPCLNKGFIRDTTGTAASRFDGPSGAFKVEGDARDRGVCASAVKELLPKNDDCSKTPSPYSFGCVFQPDFLKDSKNVLVFENFFYVASGTHVQSIDKSITDIRFPLETTPALFREKMEEVCNTPWEEIEKSYPRDNQGKDNNSKWCFGLSYAFSFLFDGLHLDMHKKITVQQQVENNDIEWALGAAYYEVGEHLKRLNDGTVSSLRKLNSN